MKRIAAVFFLLILLCSVGLAEEDANFTYIVSDDGTAEITGWSGAETELVVPRALDGHAVTRLGEYAFAYSSLERIVLPEGLTEIGVCAFNSCFSLQEVSFPSTLEIIGADAFLCCESLREILLPQSLRMIGNEAFWNCLSLETVSIPSGASIGERAFANTPAAINTEKETETR